MRIILAAIALAAMPSGALAATADPIVIHVTQADLATDNGLAKLYKRIRDAADTLCFQQENGSTGASYGLGFRQACREGAIKDAIAGANIAPLTAYVASLDHSKSLNSDTTTLAAR